MEKLIVMYKSWPLWGKILAAVPFLLLFILYILSRRPPETQTRTIDAFVEGEKDEQIQELKTEADVIAAEIVCKKKEIAEKLNQTAAIDQEAVNRREELMKASTMSELDDLQKRWGL
jgi:hypothetical protein